MEERLLLVIALDRETLSTHGGGMNNGNKT
jgi:hypothetical protein